MATCFSNARLRTMIDPVSNGLLVELVDEKEDEGRLSDSRNKFAEGDDLEGTDDDVVGSIS